jgi:hypothetical protein
MPRKGEAVESLPLGELRLGISSDNTYYPMDVVTKNDTWIVDAAINADYTSAAIDCTGKNRLFLSLTISPTSDPIANVYIQGSNLGSLYSNLSFQVGTVNTSDPTAITHTGADLTKIVVNDPASAATIDLVIVNPLPKIRIFWDRTSGGSATGLDAGYLLD